MDPLSALSIAANVLQFVEIVPSLLSSASDIYRSVNGLSIEHSSIEDVYKSLTDLSRRLAISEDSANSRSAAASSLPGTSNVIGLPADLRALQKLSLKCKHDCDELLEIVQNVAINGGKGRLWRSARAAVKGLIKKKKIADLESDIDRTRGIMSTHVLSILRHQISQLISEQRDLKEKSRSLGAEQATKLDIITQGINDLKTLGLNIKGLSAEPRNQPSTQQTELDDLVAQRMKDLKDLRLRTKKPANHFNNPELSDLDIDDITQEIKPSENLENRLEIEIDKPSNVSKKETPSARQIEDIVSSLGKAISAKVEVRKEQLVLSSLCFPSQPVRHAAIPQSHRQTFTWIYQSHFADWLKKDDAGVFWLTGKAGSGKSTLMKFLADNSGTSRIVQEWAKVQQAIIASHYFWSSGTEMQKSQQGLLQTLLFEIFRQCPSIIPIASPQRWEVQFDKRSQLAWTIPELSEILRRIGSLEHSSVKFCLFVDGLDEFSGDHYELCQTLKNLARCPDIKLCVSSRPWNVFGDFFGKDPLTKLAIHEMTREDIRIFAKSRIESHPQWQEWSLVGGSKDELIDDIVDRAEGVFLWAFLVTNSLREGISNDDTVTELKRRLESLPTDLERLFKHMLEGVEPLYHVNMAETLRIALKATAPLGWQVYHYHDQKYCDPNYAISLPVAGSSREDLEKNLERAKKRINARTRGLLEINNARIRLGGQIQVVDFIHRTVRDFLSTGEMHDYLAAESGPGFDACFSISQAYVAWIKSTAFYKGWGDSAVHSLENLLGQCLKYASEVPTSRIDDVDELINELESSIVQMSINHTPALAFEYHSDPEGFFRKIARQNNVDGYLVRNLSRNWQYISVLDSPRPLPAATLGGARPGIETVFVGLKPSPASTEQRVREDSYNNDASWFNGILGSVIKSIRS